MPYEHILMPVQVGSLRLKNRVARTSHHTGLPWSDSPDELIAYHEARARGGVALTILQTGGVHLSSPTGIPVYDDRVRSGYEKLVAAIRPHGMKLFQQLQHQGNARATHPLGGPPWSASDVPNPQVGVVPIPMSQTQIDDVVQSFAAAAVRAQQSGIDGVEIHAAHGYLVGQFLSPLTNRREDGYGGSLENRTRFLREILAAVRAETGRAYPVGVRIVADERVPGGLGPREWRAIMALIEPDIDYYNVSLSTYYKFGDIVRTMEAPLGYEMPLSEQLTQATELPTIVTGRIMTLEHADRIVAAGQASMVSMVRALIADPDLVVKAQAGREERVRPCIGSNQGCMAGAMVRGQLGCVVNPDAGREKAASSAATVERAKRILVVGGGPAGLQFASVAAQRGHRVSVYEMTRSLGGQALIAASGPGRSDIRAVVDWLADDVRRLGVDVHLSTFVEPDLVARVGADTVVLATGSTPRRDGFQVARPAEPIAGAERKHVYTVWDLFGFGGRARVGADAVVYDDTGGFEALSAAQELLDKGARVTFVTRFATLGALVPMPAMTTAGAIENLMAGKFEVITDSYLRGVDDDKVEVGSLFAGRSLRVPADTVVVAAAHHLNRELYDELAGGPADVHLVGDAAAETPSGHGLEHAIRAATVLARAI